MTTAAAPAASGARARILDAALMLVSERGSAATSMRTLAAACGLNVATIYHYFPSKADLVRALVEERRYGERMAAEQPSFDPALAPRERLAGFVRWMAEQALTEETVLRLLVGEGLRGDPTAQRSTAALLATIDATLAGWLADGLPELGDRATDVAAVVRATLLAVLVEHLVTGISDIPALADRVAAVTFA
jgi:TetR/AcrR family transcriptional regulator, tetracycline repressor protein